MVTLSDLYASLPDTSVTGQEILVLDDGAGGTTKGVLLGPTVAGQTTLAGYMKKYMEGQTLATLGITTATVGTLNATSGITINGVPVSTSTSSYWVADGSNNLSYALGTVSVGNNISVSSAGYTGFILNSGANGNFSSNGTNGWYLGNGNGGYIFMPNGDNPNVSFTSTGTTSFAGDIILSKTTPLISGTGAVNGQLYISTGAATNSGANIRMDGASSATANDMQFRSGNTAWLTWDDSASLASFLCNKLVIGSSNGTAGNVGIGTASPSTKLTIEETQTLSTATYIDAFNIRRPHALGGYAQAKFSIGRYAAGDPAASNAHSALMISTAEDGSTYNTNVVFRGDLQTDFYGNVWREGTGTGQRTMGVYDPNNGVRSALWTVNGNAYVGALNAAMDNYVALNFAASSYAFAAGNVTITGDIYTTAWTTWTPTIEVSGGTVPQYSTVSGYYKKIGKTVFCQLVLEGDGGSEGSGSAALTLTLPVNSTGDAAINCPWGFGKVTNGTTYKTVEVLGAGATLIYLSSLSGSDYTVIQGNDQNNTTRSIRINFRYQAA